MSRQQVCSRWLVRQGEHWQAGLRLTEGWWQQWSARRSRLQWFALAVGFMLTTSLLYIPLRVSAACTDINQTHMFLFWDPTSINPSTGNPYTFPSGKGWQLTTTYNGRFIRGESPANFGQTGGDGSRPFTPTVTTTVGPPNQTVTNGGTTGDYANSSHIHPAPSYTVGADNNGDVSNPDVPVFRTLQLMEYLPGSGSCLPSTIPAGTIAMFNGTTLPTGFAQYTAGNDRMIRIGSSVTTGGGDTITNTISNISGLGVDTNAANDTANRLNLFANANVSPASTHTHGPPSPNYFTTTPVSSIPPYVQPILGQATQDIPTLSINITALFDGDPGASWNILSNPGTNNYYQQFIRPGSTFNLSSQGSATHTSPATTVVSGPATPQSLDKTWNIGTGQLATADHTHNITFTFGAVSNIPPYVNFVIAQKVSFVMMSFRWYVDPGGVTGTQNTVTDPWPSGSSVDIAPDMVLPAVPAPYRPPDANEQTQLRLRAQILVAGKPLPANGTTFRLQYQATSLNDCLSGNWTDLSDPGAVWRYGTNDLTDGAQLGGTSVFAPPYQSTVMQTFSKSDAGGTALNAATTGALMEYDWLIQDTGAQSGTQYYFRVVEGNGTPLGSYINTTTFKAECPGITTRPGLDQQLRHGEFFLTNPNASGANKQDPDQGFEWAD